MARTGTSSPIERGVFKVVRSGLKWGGMGEQKRELAGREGAERSEKRNATEEELSDWTW